MKRILITGGASGLGEAITRKLALEEDSFVIFSYCKSEKKARSIEKEFKNTRAVKCDFSNSTDIESLCGIVEENGLDVLINNAFCNMTTSHFHKTEPALFLNNFKANVMPVIRLTQNAIGIFRKNRSGKIITILTSYLVGNPPVGSSEYVAAKAYLASLSKSWAVENAYISSNCISPSFMKTQLTSDVDERLIQDMVNKHPLKRLVTVDEVAETVRFLVSASQQINGVNVVMNAATHIL